MTTSATAINPHTAQPTSLVALGQSLWRNRQLIVQMTKRDVVGRYKGSAFGLAWSFFNPVFMLVVYTFVFSVIFKSRWGGAAGDDSKTQFAVLLFVGIIITVLMFLSPVFYPITAVPERFRPFIMANPLTFIIEQARAVLIWGQLPDWLGLGIYALVATAIAWAGYAWFQKTRRGFADVL